MVVSTGVGGGIVLDGRLLDGSGGNAGHIGHVVVEPDGRACACGGRGCLEAEASGTAIAAVTGRPAAEADRTPPVADAGRWSGGRWPRWPACSTCSWPSWPDRSPSATVRTSSPRPGDELRARGAASISPARPASSPPASAPTARWWARPPSPAIGRGAVAAVRVMTAPRPARIPLLGRRVVHRSCRRSPADPDLWWTALGELRTARTRLWWRTPPHLPASRPAPVGVPDGDRLREARRRPGPEPTWSPSWSGAGPPPPPGSPRPGRSTGS